MVLLFCGTYNYILHMTANVFKTEVPVAPPAPHSQFVSVGYIRDSIYPSLSRVFRMTRMRLREARGCERETNKFVSVVKSHKSAISGKLDRDCRKTSRCWQEVINECREDLIRVENLCL